MTTEIALMQTQMKKAWSHTVFFPSGLRTFFHCFGTHPEEDKQSIWRPYCRTKLHSENYKIVSFIEYSYFRKTLIKELLLQSYYFHSTKTPSHHWVSLAEHLEHCPKPRGLQLFKHVYSCLKLSMSWNVYFMVPASWGGSSHISSREIFWVPNLKEMMSTKIKYFL